MDVKILVVMGGVSSTTLTNADLVAEKFELEGGITGDTVYHYGDCLSSRLRFTACRKTYMKNGVETLIDWENAKLYVMLGTRTLVGRFKVYTYDESVNKDQIEVVAYDYLRDAINHDCTAWYENYCNTYPNGRKITDFANDFGNYLATQGILETSIYNPHGWASSFPTYNSELYWYPTAMFTAGGSTLTKPVMSGKISGGKILRDLAAVWGGSVFMTSNQGNTPNANRSFLALALPRDLCNTSLESPITPTEYTSLDYQSRDTDVEIYKNVIIDAYGTTFSGSADTTKRCVIADNFILNGNIGKYYNPDNGSATVSPTLEIVAQNMTARATGTLYRPGKVKLFEYYSNQLTLEPQQKRILIGTPDATYFTFCNCQFTANGIEARTLDISSIETTDYYSDETIYTSDNSYYEGLNTEGNIQAQVSNKLDVSGGGISTPAAWNVSDSGIHFAQGSNTAIDIDNNGTTINADIILNGGISDIGSANQPLYLANGVFQVGNTTIDNTVSDLVNYYTINEVNSLISGITGLDYSVVASLPTSDISPTTIYLVAASTSTSDNYYDEWLYVNSAWELIGNTAVDLTDYVTTSALTSTLSSYATQSDISDFITASVLSSTLTDYVTNTALTSTLSDYATTSDLADYVLSSTLASTLSSYATDSELSTALADYVLSSTLTSTLSSYTTNSALTSTLSSYVTGTALSSTLSAYVSDASYVHTDNNYTNTDKSKLSGIAAGAEVNQNAFSNVKVGTSTIAADSKTDTLELVAGSNITLTADTTNDKVTIAATVPSVTDTWRKVQLNGVDKLGTGTNTNPLNLKAGSNVSITESSGTFTFAATDTVPNNATLTIQKNGTTVKTFTANASSDVTCNISVPTKLSDLTDDVVSGNYIKVTNAGYQQIENTANEMTAVAFKSGNATKCFLALRNSSGNPVGLFGAENSIPYFKTANGVDKELALVENTLPCKKFKALFNTVGWHKVFSISLPSTAGTHTGTFLISWGGLFSNNRASAGNALLIMSYNERRIIPLGGKLLGQITKLRISGTGLSATTCQIDAYYGHTTANTVNLKITQVSYSDLNIDSLVTVLDGSADTSTSTQEISAGDEVLTTLSTVPIANGGTGATSIAAAKSKLGIPFYGACGTAENTKDKVVTCAGFTSDMLISGATINVRFTYPSGTNRTMTLNVNSTGAESINTRSGQVWDYGAVVTFVYDGTEWIQANIV